MRFIRPALLLVLGAIRCSGAISLVQSASADSSSTVATVTVSSTGSGNLLVIAIEVWTSSGQSFTFKHNGSSVTYTNIGVAASDTTNFRGSYMFYRENISSGTTSVEVTSSGGNFTAVVMEFSGAVTSSSLDKAVGKSDAASSGTPTTPLSGTLSQADEVVIGTISAINNPSTVNFPWTLVHNVGNGSQFQRGGAVAYLVVSATTSVQATFNMTSTTYSALTASFKASAGGGGATVPQMMMMGVGP